MLRRAKTRWGAPRVDKHNPAQSLPAMRPLAPYCPFAKHRLDAMDPFGERSPEKVMMGVGLGQASFSVSSLDDRRIGNTSARFREIVWGDRR